MTLQEFFKRTGIETTAEEFDGIHRMYLAAGAMCKDDFCTAYKGLNKTSAPLALTLTQTVESREQKIDELRAEIDTLKTDRDEAAEQLVCKAHELNDKELLAIAIAMIGTREVVMTTLRHGLHLL